MKPFDVTADALIDVLAADGDELDSKGVILLCSVWGVQPVIRYPAGGGRSYYDWMATVRALARRVQQEQATQNIISNASLTPKQARYRAMLNEHTYASIIILAQEWNVPIVKITNANGMDEYDYNAMLEALREIALNDDQDLADGSVS